MDISEKQIELILEVLEKLDSFDMLEDKHYFLRAELITELMISQVIKELDK